MRKGTAAVLAVAAISGGFLIGRVSRDKGSDKPEATVAAPGGAERRRVPLEGHAKGPANALVNIVEFSDFQCPFCSKVNPTLERLMKEHPGKIRVFFRHYPLPFHGDAGPAAQATEAAAAQGKFWEMHDKLFANQQNLKRPDLEKYAQELGLDGEKFKAALDSGAHKARVDQDVAAAQKLGVQGTPHFFINGRRLNGAQPYDIFAKIVEEELAAAQKLVSQGTPAERVYEKLMEQASAVAAPAAAAPPAQPAASAEVYKVEVGKAPSKGGKEPKVSLVVFSEFECPFCAKVNTTVEALLAAYGDDVQVAFKHFPLPMHKNAQLAAYAAEAAREQGKFWEMHDKLFSNQQSLDRASLDKYAQELGLDATKFKAALDGETHKAAVEADMAQAMRFGVRSTPSFFINGRLLRGAQPLENFKAVIDGEIKRADEKLKAGTARGQLYAELIKEGLDKAAAPTAPAPRPGAPAASEVYKAQIAGAPIKGTKDALVTIVQFSDYQCPFCARVEPTIDRVMEDYKGKVRVAWRDLPLPFHEHAVPAAIAARAAGSEGKFWQMHKKLFENQQKLDRASLEQYASALGLNMSKFKAALDQQKYKKEIEADAAMGAKIGATGTPAFFINGTFLSGAQPYERFKQRIDEELKKAEALVGKGTPKSKVYDVIMKDAKEQVAAAAAAAPAAAGPEHDMTVFKVEPGNSPSRGPKNAPITMVVFSEFQCPFCKKVKPAFDQVDKEYPGKIRVVWKNFPLDFHQNARPAAEAAMAAADQGKFWAMHDKLFENQERLDRASLEKYAEELGLDMGKFRAALDGHKHAAAIDADMKLAASVGVDGTPATFINGRKIGGAYPFGTFKTIIDQELAKTNKGRRGVTAVN